MLKVVLLVIGVLIAGVLAVAAMQPDSFRVQRSVVIQAPADRIFPLINDFHRWSAWSPYEKLDPQMKRTFSGAPAGVGATYAWEGDGKVGAGRMEMTEASAPSKLRIKLDFFKPFKASNTAEFVLEPKGNSTEVTWAMYGPSHFISKVMGLFFNMENLIGGDFEKGLMALKAAAEK